MEKSKEILNEIRIRPYRKDCEYSYTCGVFPTIELLKNKPEYVFRVLLSSQGEKSSGAEIIREICEKAGIPVMTDDKTIERISAKENCLAVGVFTKYESELRRDRNHVVLVNPSDMGNMGTILRTSSAFGYEDIAVITPACDVYDPKVLRASMGAFFGIRVKQFDSFEKYLNAVGNGENRNFYPFMLKGGKLTADIPEKAYEESRKGKYFTLIFGNEARGLDDFYLELGTPVRIPHRNTVDSLNLPIAVSIGEYMFADRGDNL